MRVVNAWVGYCIGWLRGRFPWFNWLMKQQWFSWVGHSIVGFSSAFLLDQFGYGLAVGFYGGKEYKESDQLRNISKDNVMDFVSPTIAGLIGLVIRRVVF